MNIESVLLSELVDEFYYVPNTGNAGDSVIESATFGMFDKLNLQYKLTTSASNEFVDRVVVLAGGGALTNEEASYTKVLRECAEKAKKVIVLPHTIKDIDSTIARYGGKVVFFCREKNSYDYVRGFNTSAYLVDDLAFSLDVAYFSRRLESRFKLGLIIYFFGQRLGLIKGKMRLKHLVKSLDYTRIINKAISTSDQSSILNAFRQDDERTDIAIPENNFDISATYQLELGDKKLSHCATHMMIKTISAFDEIHTNRLHVAIVSAILDKKVKFYNNSYFKCKAVYLKSIENEFRKVEFIDEMFS